MKAVGHLPAALLVIVALHQISATVYGDLTPWLGGGFGMFASLDTPGNRVVSVHLLEPDIRREIDVPGLLREVAERAVAFPTEHRLSELAVLLGESPEHRYRKIEAVEVTVWRVWPAPEPIRTVRVDVAR